MNTLIKTLLFSAAFTVFANFPFAFAADQNTQRNNPQQKHKDQSQTPIRSQPRVVRHPPVGKKVPTLPKKQVPIRVNRDNYHYYNGTFYRPRPRGNYIVVRPPIGARVTYLPTGFISFYIGTSRYFYINYTYYLWDSASSVYVVVEKPVGATAAVIESNEMIAHQIFAYPNSDQSLQQQEKDRYECYLWAVEQTGFDPATLDPDSDKANDYRRAASACLEARDYIVK